MLALIPYLCFRSAMSQCSSVIYLWRHAQRDGGLALVLLQSLSLLKLPCGRILLVFAKYLFCTLSRVPEVLLWTRRVAIIPAWRRFEALRIDLSSYFRNAQRATAVASLSSQISSKIAQSPSRD